MLLNEIFGYDVEIKPKAEKSIKRIHKLLKAWREHLHLAHTKQGHAGEDVRDELHQLYKEIKPIANDIFSHDSEDFGTIMKSARRK